MVIDCNRTQNAPPKFRYSDAAKTKMAPANSSLGCTNSMNSGNDGSGFDSRKLPFFESGGAVASEVDGDFFQFAVEMAADEVFLMNAESKIIYVNRSACRQLGYKHKELLGMYVWEWDPLFPKEAWPEFWAELLSSKRVHFESQHKKKNGEVFPVEIYGHLFTLNSEQFILAFVHDITEKKKAELVIYEKANFDHLTHLPNRYLFSDRLLQAFSNAKRNRHSVALYFIDLDRLKEVNDSLGHDAGDQLLVATANRLRQCVREMDTVARLGGDEFVIIAENISRDAVGLMALKLTEAFAKPFDINGQSWAVTVSVGVSVYPEHAMNADDLVKRADESMYRAKLAGRNQFCIYNSSKSI